VKKVGRYKGGETHDKSVLYTLLIIAMYIQYNKHVITTGAERDDVPSCRFLSWKSNFCLGLLTANLAGEEAGKKRGREATVTAQCLFECTVKVIGKVYSSTSH